MAEQRDMIHKMKAGHPLPQFQVIRRGTSVEDFPQDLGDDVILFLRSSPSPKAGKLKSDTSRMLFGGTCKHFLEAKWTDTSVHLIWNRSHILKGETGGVLLKRMGTSPRIQEIIVAGQRESKKPKEIQNDITANLSQFEDASILVDPSFNPNTDHVSIFSKNFLD